MLLPQTALLADREPPAAGQRARKSRQRGPVWTLAASPKGRSGRDCLLEKKPVHLVAPGAWFLAPLCPASACTRMRGWPRKVKSRGGSARAQRARSSGMLRERSAGMRAGRPGLRDEGLAACPGRWPGYCCRRRRRNSQAKARGPAVRDRQGKVREGRVREPLQQRPHRPGDWPSGAVRSTPARAQRLSVQRGADRHRDNARRRRRET